MRLVLPAAAVCIVLAVAGCGGSAAPPARQGAHKHATHARRAVPLALTAHPLTELTSAVQDAAAAALPDGRLVLLGGIDSSGGSTDAIDLVSGSRVTPHGTLPAPQHDAQAAVLGGQVYVFGGGVVASYDHILRYDPATGTVAPAGTLPTDASDVAVAAQGATAYVVGGYTGSTPLDTILAYTAGRAPRVVGRLPSPLRYAAVALSSGRLIIAGGTQPQGVSDAILSFDPATGALRRLGSLPHPLTHASAVALDGLVVIVGGKRQLSGGQTTDVLAIDPVSGHLTRVGRLPQPLSDAATVSDGGRILVAGGENGSGPQRQVLELEPARSGAGS